MTTIHRPARLATRAASFRYGGRHHSGIPGGIIPLYPGGFVGIGKREPYRTSQAANGHVDQYVSIKYTERLAEAGIEPSVGSVGNSYDNALAETINGLYKVEVIHRTGPWRNFEAVEFATLEWVDWFNNRRLLEPIGFIPPAEAEERYFAMLNDTAMAA